MINYNPLAYTSPETNTRLEFIYSGAIQDETTHNLGEFSFAGYDGKHYQDKSLTSGVYAFTLKLQSEDALRELRSILNEKATPESTGTLEHPDPTLGSFPAVVASFKVNQNSLKGQGVITVEVTFYRTIPDLLSGNSFAEDNPASAQSTLSAIDELNINQATDLANSVDLSTGAGFAAFVQSTLATIQEAKAQLEAISRFIDEVSIAFTDAYLDILNNVEEYANTPFELARKVQNFIQLPMIASNTVNERISAYKDFLSGSQDFSASTQAEISAGSPAGKTTLANKAMASLAAVSAINYCAVSGQSVSIDKITSGEDFDNGGYLSRQQIIDTIDSIQTTGQDTTNTLSALAVNFGSDIFFSQYFDYSILNKALISRSIQNLNNRIFSSVAEQIFVTIKELTPIELSSILYQSVELSTIQFLLESNKLHGNNIFMIPKGTPIKHY